jgi:glycosyltransferase involved in cell wall biosynthesis
MGGAVEKAWFSLAREFVRRGHEVVQVSRAVPQFPGKETIGGVKHLRLRGFDAPRSLAWLKVLDLIYSIRTMWSLPAADIIVTNTFWLPILLRNSKRGRLYVHVARYPKGQTRFYGSAARLQAPSHAVARAVMDDAPQLASRVSVIPYPAPGSTSGSEPPPVDQRQKIILFVGRIHPEKGVDLLLDAFAGKANAIFAGWKLMIIGSAESKFGGGGEEYLAGLRRLAQDAAVIFRGPVFDPLELENEFRSARIFVYPSLAERGETFGLAPLEAMSNRCAALVSDLACFRDFIRDGETGFAFDHRGAPSSRALRDRLEKIIADPTLLSQTADAGYRKSAEYSLASVADQFLGDFNSIIRNSDAATGSR